MQVAVKHRASRTSPFCSALIANGEPIDAPLFGLLKISQSVSLPLPASPMQPVPIPPSGNDISLVFTPLYMNLFISLAL